jgi:hypothetical protein
MAKKRKTEKTKTWAECPWTKDKETFKRAHGLALTLFSAGDDYVQAVAEVITRSKDGSSRRNLDMLGKALWYQSAVRELFAYLDPKHYTEEKH